MKFKAVVITILSLLVAVISIQNAAVVDLKFFTWDFSISRILLILISFALGLVVGYLLSIKKKTKPSKSDVSPRMN
jgi:uncharacterized integral membrane protein